MKGNKIIVPVFFQEGDEKWPYPASGVACIPYRYIMDPTNFNYTVKNNQEIEFYSHEKDCSQLTSSEIDAECSCGADLPFLCDMKEWSGRAMPVVIAPSVHAAAALIEATDYLVKRTSNIYFMK